MSNRHATDSWRPYRPAAADAALDSRRKSKAVSNPLVQKRVAAVTDAMAERKSSFATRNPIQRRSLALPALPTTTIGSFPQTPAIRQTRAAYKRGDIGALEYLERIRAEIETAVRRQEALGLDVLVHGEAERNDMVEYFGEQLWGYAFTENGWVQSYGSRCVETAHYLRRYLSPRTDDGRDYALRAVADRSRDEGHADGSGHDAAMVVRSR